MHFFLWIYAPYINHICQYVSSFGIQNINFINWNLDPAPFMHDYDNVHLITEVNFYGCIFKQKT